MLRDCFPHRVVRLSFFIQCALVVLLFGGAVQNLAAAALPVSGRDWFEAAPSVFTGRYGAASVVFNNKIWLIGGHDGYARSDVWSSPDGVNWTRVANAPFARRARHACAVYNGRIWVIGGMSFEGIALNDVWSSADGVNWTQSTEHAPFSRRYELAAASFNGALWMVGGSVEVPNYYNDAWYTLDGVNWNKAPTPIFAGRRGHSLLTYNNRLWVIGGLATDHYKADVYSTADGNTWTTATTTAAIGVRFNHASVVHNGAMWVLGGQTTTDGAKNDAWRSTDGINWTRLVTNADFSPRAYHTAVSFGGEMWLMTAGSSNDIYHSADGATWTQTHAATPAAGLPNQTGTVHNGKIWIAGSNPDYQPVTILNSPDGANWSGVANNLKFGANAGYSILSFNDELWIVGCSNGYVYHSSDGSTWSSEEVSGTLGPRGGAAALVFNNRMWIIGSGGGMTDVWYSYDGLGWTKATSAAGFSPRANFAAVAFKNRLWVIGGSMRNDVWSSADGKTWRQETAAAAFTGRSQHGAAVFDGKMWVLGGKDSSGLIKDAWSSRDGINWTRETSSAFSYRDRPNSLAFDGKLWVLAGYKGQYDIRRDSWFTYRSRQHLHLSTHAVDLGARIIGAGPSAATTITLTNDGLSTLTVSAITLSGANESQFKLAALALPAIMPPMTSRVVTVAVEPTVSGSLQASLSFVSNDPEEPEQTVALTGEGIANGLNASPLVVDFGDQFVTGEASPTRRILLTNNSSQPITINSLKLSGSSCFGLASSLGSTLIEAGATRALEVFFKPTEAGLQVGYVNISASGQASIKVAMEGMGVMPVTGRDWFEAVPAVFSPRSNMAVLNHQNKLWVIGGHDGQIRSDVWSGDGTNWSRVTASAIAAREGFASAEFNGRMWLFGGSNPTHRISITDVSVRYYSDAWSSADGVNWTAEPIRASFLRAGHTVTEFNGKLFLIGGEYSIDVQPVMLQTCYRDVWSSNDGTHWDVANQSPPFIGRRDHAAVVFKNKLWVVGGRNRWSSYNNDLLNDVWSSADGTNWTTATTHAEFSPRYDHACFVLGDKLWLVGGIDASGKNGEIWNTSDGAHWTRVTSGQMPAPCAGHACVAVGSEIWLIGGSYEGAWHTSDGSHWTQVPPAHPGARSGQATIAYNGNLWVIGGSGDGLLRNDIWSSPDARRWTRVTEHAAFNPISNLVGLSFGGKMWLMGGSGRVWRSSNGADWTTITTSAAFLDIDGGLIHNNKMWVFNGASFWSSADGLNWTRATGTFTGRNDMGVAALNGKMYILGGWRMGFNGRFSWTELVCDVWSSGDGDAWTQATTSGPARAYPGAVMFDQRLWVVGGQNYTYTSGMGGAYFPVYQSPVLVSYNGVAWTALGNVPFALRSDPSMNVLGNRLYVSGGVNYDGSPSDFWYTPGDGLASRNSAHTNWIQYK